MLEMNGNTLVMTFFPWLSISLNFILHSERQIWEKKRRCRRHLVILMAWLISKDLTEKEKRGAVAEFIEVLFD